MGPAGTPLDHAEIIARLRLIRSENVGPVTFGHLLRRYGDAICALAALAAPPELAAQGGLGSEPAFTDGPRPRRNSKQTTPSARVIVRGMAEYRRCWSNAKTRQRSFRYAVMAIGAAAVAMVGARSLGDARGCGTLAETVAANDYAVVSGMAAALTPPPIRARFPAARWRCWAAALM